MAVSRVSRDKCLQLVQGWLNGKVLNLQLEDEWPKCPSDGSIAAIAGQLWLMYDDFPEKPIDKSRLGSQQRQLIVHILEFLASDFEYLWPDISFETGGVGFLGRILPGFSKRYENNVNAYKMHGDASVWPFHDKGQWSSARRWEPIDWAG